MTRPESELFRAFAGLGTALRFGESSAGLDTHRIYAAFSCLGWVLGAEDTVFAELLGIVEKRLAAMGIDPDEEARKIAEEEISRAN